MKCPIYEMFILCNELYMSYPIIYVVSMKYIFIRCLSIYGPKFPTVNYNDDENFG